LQEKNIYLVAKASIDGFLQIQALCTIYKTQVSISMIRLLLEIPRTTTFTTTASRGCTPYTVTSPEPLGASILSVAAHPTKIRKDGWCGVSAWRGGVDSIIRVVIGVESRMIVRVGW
jgi:hypothetical protein